MSAVYSLPQASFESIINNFGHAAHPPARGVDRIKLSKSLLLGKREGFDKSIGSFAGGRIKSRQLSAVCIGKDWETSGNSYFRGHG